MSQRMKQQERECGMCDFFLSLHQGEAKPPRDQRRRDADTRHRRLAGGSVAEQARQRRLAREQAADQRHLQAGRTVIGDTTHAPRWVKSAEVGHRSIRP